jgi:ubiquinone/menaquinone biosynthesis C-methylase UbiE
MTFSRTARWYDALYVHGLQKDYAAEAAAVADVIDAARPGAKTLLDVACGTGLHLVHLADRFECVGLDVDGRMLGVARERLPTISFVEGDMAGFDLGQRFDAVTCLFSSIAYMATQDRLGAAVASMAAHLEPGGVLVVEPFIQPEHFIEGHIGFLTVDLPEVKVARMNSSRVDGQVVTMDFSYLVGEGARVERLEEQHVLGLFTWDQYRGAFEAAGLTCEVDEVGIFGRGLVVGVSPPDAR